MKGQKNKWQKKFFFRINFFLVIIQVYMYGMYMYVYMYI